MKNRFINFGNSRLFLVILFFAYYNTGSAQFLDWGLNLGGSGSDFCKSMTVGGSGNIYVLGEVGSNNVDFDPSTGSTSLSCEAYVVKYSETGSFQWIIPLGDCFSGSNFVDPYSLDEDENGDVYVTGSFEGTVDFDPSTGTANLTAGSNEDVFVAKYNSNGKFLWCFDLGSSSDDWGSTVKYDGSTNIYVYGSFRGTIDFDPSGSTQNLSADIYGDAFLAKYDTAGNYVWAFSIPNGQSPKHTSMDINGSGQIIVGGWFYDTTDFDPGVSVAQYIPVQTGGYQNMFFASYNANMTYNWANHLRGPSSSDFNALDVDGSGNIYITGDLTGTVDFNPGTATFNLSGASAGDIFVGKYGIGGDLLWAFEVGNSNTNHSRDVSVDVYGNVYITGYMANTIDFDPGSGVANISANSNGFVAKYSPNGDYDWAYPITSSFGNGYAIKPMDSTRVVFTGDFTGNGDFDPSSGTTNFSSNGNQDIYLMVWDQCLTEFSSDSAFSCDSFVSPSGKYIWTVSNTYTDSLISAKGCDSIVTINLLIYSSPVVDSINASEFICDSGNVDLYAYSSSGTIRWFDVPTGGTLLDTGIKFTTPIINSSTTYYVESSNNTCTSLRTLLTVPVVTTPQIISVTPSFICDTGITTLFATSTGATLRWFDTIAGGASLGTGVSFATPLRSTPNTYYVEADYLGCVNPVRTPVFVDAFPTPIFTSISPGNRCDAGIISIGATVDTGTVYWHYTSSTIINADSGNTWTFNLVNSSFRYVSASLNGCVSARIQVSATITPTPTITNSINGSRCDSGSVILGGAASAGMVYWYDTISGGQTLDSGISVSTPVIDSTRLFYIEAIHNGCTSLTRTAVTATVNYSPLITSVTNGSRCDSGSVLLQASATAGTKKWYSSLSSSTSIYNGANFTTPIINTTTTFYVEAIDIGCVSPRDSAIATILSSDQTSISDTACFVYVSPSGLYTYTNSGMYSDTLQNSNGCDSVILINLTIDTVDASVVQNGIELSSTAQSATYQWIDCDNGNIPIANETGSVFTANTNGRYAVVITQSNCTDTSKCFEVTTVGIEQKPTNRINIFPNPFVNYVNIHFGSVYSRIEIKVLNDLGQMMLSKTYNKSNQIQLDLSSLTSGVYSLSIEMDGNISNVLLIKK